MPPRFAFWTILIDGKPTAFRARDPQELLPTCNQLKRTSRDVVMRWFARGRLWESPEAERAASHTPKPPMERRGRDWRPGGTHQDPRARFDKEAQRRRKREMRAEQQARGPRSSGAPGEFKPGGPPRKPWTPRPPGPPRSDRPWSGKPHGDKRPWTGKPGTPPGDRPWQTKSFGKPGTGAHGKASGPWARRKPWQGKPFGKPAAGAHGGAAGPGAPRKPWLGKPGDPRRRKRKNDEPKQG